MLNRRDVLETAITAGALAVSTGAVGAGRDPEELLPIVDTNVSLFRWPFRRLPLDTAKRLVSRLRSLGVVRAWAGSFEGVFHRDLGGVNRRLASVCKEFRELEPIGVVNPTLPRWETDLQACEKQLGMRGIRLYPNYHGYTLRDPRFRMLLQRAAAAGLLVQVTAALEDVRTQPEKLRIADVDLNPLTDFMPEADGVRVQILNARPSPALVQKLATVPDVYFDTARVDGTDGVPGLVRSLPANRVLFGSHSPFLIPEAAMIRVHESDQLNALQLQSVYGGNAERLLERSNA